jgi:von Willebrand factor type A domain
MARRTNESIASTLNASEDEESYVDLMDLENLLGDKTLTLALTPKNKSIGIKSNVTSALVCATIKACTLPEEKERTPVDIIVALDISSSMRFGDKLSLCKLTIEHLLRNLLPHDRFGLITYCDDAVIKSHLQLMTTENKHKVLSAVKNLHAHGSTNISAAIALSFQELRSVSSPNKIRSIFLLTDGHGNRGISDQKGLVDLTRSCWNDAKNAPIETSPFTLPLNHPHPSFFGSFLTAKKDNTVAPCEAITTDSEQDASPVSLLCFGYGNDHNAPMLRDISDVTETGSYYYVETDSDVSSAFGDALGGLVSIVAQSAVLTLIPPSKDIQILRVHHDSVIRGEDVSANINGATYTVSLGDFYAAETRDVLVEVTLENTVTSIGEKAPKDGIVHLLATLSYTDILKKTPIRSPKRIVCSIERPDNDEVSADNEYIAKQWIRVYATKEMEEAEKVAQLGQFDEAKRRLQEVKDLIAKTETSVRNDVMIDQLGRDLQESMNGCTSRLEYNSFGSKHLANHQQTYKKQRMSTANALKRSPYRSSIKQQMAVEFREHTSAIKEEP